MKKALILLIMAAIILASCTSSKNYSKSPCWKGAEPRNRTSKMRA